MNDFVNDEKGCFHNKFNNPFYRTRKSKRFQSFGKQFGFTFVPTT